jgi:hypothetical protein
MIVEQGFLRMAASGIITATLLDGTGATSASIPTEVDGSVETR